MTATGGGDVDGALRETLTARAVHLQQNTAAAATTGALTASVALGVRLDDVEPLSSDVLSLQDQVVRMRALLIDMQRALEAAREDAGAYERELTALRWQNVTGRLPAGVPVLGAASVLADTATGETTSSGAVIRGPRAVVGDYTGSLGAHKTAQYVTSAGVPATLRPALSAATLSGASAYTATALPPSGRAAAPPAVPVSPYGSVHAAAATGLASTPRTYGGAGYSGAPVGAATTLMSGPGQIAAFFRQ